MTNPLKVALSLSVGLHTVALVGLPATEPVAFDVERAPTSVELYLIAEATAATTPARVVEQASPPVDATAAITQEQPPEPHTVVTQEQKGARLDHPPSYLRNPPPVYPRAAREQGHEGTTLLEVEVLPSGRCGRLRVVRSSGSAVLDQAAMEAVRQWVFKPARRWREPVAFHVEIPVTFRLVDADERVTATRNP